MWNHNAKNLPTDRRSPNPAQGIHSAHLPHNSPHAVLQARVSPPSLPQSPIPTSFSTFILYQSTGERPRLIHIHPRSAEGIKISTSPRPSHASLKLTRVYYVLRLYPIKAWQPRSRHPDLPYFVYLQTFTT